MEDRPPLRMLTVSLKETLPTEFAISLKRHIRDHYQESPDSYNDEIRSLEMLRRSAVNPTRDYSGSTCVRRYYGQLHLLQARFPMMEGGSASVNFSWTDSITGKSSSASDIRFEQASVLFNVGALHCTLASHDSRSSEESNRVACTHYQCAAGAFDTLNEQFSGAGLCSDTSSMMLLVLKSIMLGQAQECLLDKSIRDKRNASLTAKMAMQIVEFFQMAYDVIKQPKSPVFFGKKQQKRWEIIVQAKVYYYNATARLFMAEVCEEQRKYGEKVAWLQSAHAYCAEITKMPKQLGEDWLKDAVTFLVEHITRSLQASTKDNDSVYHELVPRSNTLAEIQKITLVKALSFDPTDPSVAGPDVFAKLVPLRAHEQASVYSEEKARLLRQARDEVAEKDRHLEEFLKTINLRSLAKGKAMTNNDLVPGDIRAMATDMSEKKVSLLQALDKAVKVSKVAD